MIDIENTYLQCSSQALDRNTALWIPLSFTCDAELGQALFELPLIDAWADETNEPDEISRAQESIVVRVKLYGGSMRV